MAGVVPPRHQGVNQEPCVPDADHLTEEQKMFREAYQKNAGQPSRLRTEHARETAFGEPSAVEVREAQRTEAGMGPSSDVQQDFQDVDPRKAAKPQQSAGEVVAERSAPPPAGQASNTFGALPADETV